MLWKTRNYIQTKDKTKTTEQKLKKAQSHCLEILLLMSWLPHLFCLFNASIHN